MNTRKISWGALVGFGLGLIIFAGQTKAGMIVLATAMMLAVTQKVIGVLGPCKGLGALMAIATVSFVAATVSGHHVAALANLAGLVFLAMGRLYYQEKGKA